MEATQPEAAATPRAMGEMGNGVQSWDYPQDLEPRRGVPDRSWDHQGIMRNWPIARPKPLLEREARQELSQIRRNTLALAPLHWSLPPAPDHSSPTCSPAEEAPGESDFPWYKADQGIGGRRGAKMVGSLARHVNTVILFPDVHQCIHLVTELSDTLYIRAK